jgi:hypothetical protein
MTAAPRRLTISVPGSDEPWAEALVVTLGDGRLGFAAREAEAMPYDGRTVVVDSESWTASVVRSGTAYEEVRGRARAAEGWWARWRGRHDEVAVVLVRVS